MQSTNNDTTSISAEDLKGLTGEELKKVLAKRVAKIKEESQAIYDDVDSVAKEVENIRRGDEESEEREDNAFIEKAEQGLGDDLDKAVVDLASTDEELKIIEE